MNAVRAHGGRASMADMASYKPIWSTPLSLRIGDGVAIGPAATNIAGCSVFMALNLLNHASPADRYWTDAKELRNLVLATRLAVAAPYSAEVAEVDAQLRSGGGCFAHLRSDFGDAAMTRLDALARTRATAPTGHHSAAVVVVDRWGDIAALVHSSNTPLWGDTGLVVGGIPLPAPAGIYQQRLMHVSPGGRVPSDMTPLMVFRHGKPELAIAAIGVSNQPETVRLVRGLSNDPDLLAWLEAPPLLTNLAQMDLPLIDRDELIPGGEYPDGLPSQLEALGLRTRKVDAAKAAILRGTAAVVRFSGKADIQTGEAPGVLTFGAAR